MEVELLDKILEIVSLEAWWKLDVRDGKLKQLVSLKLASYPEAC
jgi:hypothetical protein